MTDESTTDENVGTALSDDTDQEDESPGQAAKRARLKQAAKKLGADKMKVNPMTGAFPPKGSPRSPIKPQVPAIPSAPTMDKNAVTKRIKDALRKAMSSGDSSTINRFKKHEGYED